MPDPAGRSPSSSLFSPYKCRLTVFINGSTVLSSHEPFLLWLVSQGACKLQRSRAMAGSGLDLGETFLSSAPTTCLGSSRGESWGGPRNFPRGLCDSSGEVSSRQELSGDLLSMQMRGALFSLLLKCKSASESNFLILHLQLIIMQPYWGFSLFLPFLLSQDTGVITPGEDRRQAFLKAGCQCPG